MKILITNRKWIEQKAVFPAGLKVALISICDTDLAFAKPNFSPFASLRVKFNDVYFETLPQTDKNQRLKFKKKSCTRIDDAAKQIAQFYLGLPADTDILICQCEFGQSRSAAVAAAIIEYKAKKGIDVFLNDKYCPNKLVFKKVLNALKNSTAK